MLRFSILLLSLMFLFAPLSLAQEADKELQREANACNTRRLSPIADLLAQAGDGVRNGFADAKAAINLIRLLQQGFGRFLAGCGGRVITQEAVDEDGKSYVITFEEGTYLVHIQSGAPITVYMDFLIRGGCKDEVYDVRRDDLEKHSWQLLKVDERCSANIIVDTNAPEWVVYFERLTIEKVGN